MYAWMCDSVSPEQFDGFYSYSAFRCLSITVRCPVNLKILAPRIGAVQMDPKMQIGDFLENDYNDFD
jgi:hypothetical protein